MAENEQPIFILFRVGHPVLEYNFQFTLYNVGIFISFFQKKLQAQSKNNKTKTMIAA